MQKLIKLAWKNISYRPINSGLCIGLLLFGISIITVLLLLQNQLVQKFERDLQSTDLVLGAKGSPLQLVLSAIYHLDAPTGNINYAEAQKVMNHPQVAEAIPLAYGDSYLGYRILGTTSDYLTKYKAEFQKGELFSEVMQVNLGAHVAKTSNLNLGDTFYGTHGDTHAGHVHDDHAYKVVGIIHKTNTVLDNLILTPIESVWQVHHKTDQSHGSETDKISEHNHEGHDEHNHEEHNHDHDKHKIEKEHAEDHQDITAVLLKYKTKRALMSMPAFINKQTNMQAVLPALEINRLFYMLGIGSKALKWIAYGIILMAGFSVFFSLYSRLRERQYELALMRTLGYRPKDLFILLLIEGLILVSIGYILGWLLSRLGLFLINREATRDFKLHFSAEWTTNELGLLVLTLAVGVVASLLPAWKALRTEASNKLSKI